MRETKLTMHKKLAIYGKSNLFIEQGLCLTRYVGPQLNTSREVCAVSCQ